jgi:flagellar hook-associated protein 2
MSTTPTSSSTLTNISGISTGVDTTALINAIVAQKGVGLTRLQAQRTLNDAKTTALNSLNSELSTFGVSMLALQDSFNSRTVTSTDINNAYVTATGKGVATGNYDVSVHTVATKGRVSATLDSSGLPTNLAVASPTDSVNSNIFTPGTPASFAIQGTDGVIKTITMTEGSNTLNGLAAAINASGAGVTAQVVNTGKGAKPYQLVLSANATGTGTTKGVVAIVDVTNQSGGSAGAPANNLGILAGTVDSMTAPTAITGGLTSTTSGATATDATFSLNGIELTRGTNVVKDAADGMTFTLKQGGQTGVTTLTVAPDKGGATTAMQTFIANYNKLVTDYKTASTSTKNADGSINQAPLANDPSTRAFMANLQSALKGASAGMPSSTSYKTLASMGVTSLADGTLNMNIIAFQTAMGDDLTAALNLFKFSGTSTSQNVAVTSGGAQTATGNVDFAITKDAGGTLWGTLTQNGVTTAPIQVVSGTLQGTGNYTGLNLAVTGTGSGTVTLARGSGQAAADLISSFTGVSGGINIALKSITVQDANLDLQIQSAQSRLNTETANLKKQFAQMEAVVGQMKAAAGALTGA